MAKRKVARSAKGLFIAFEGGEGAGKSTQRKRLVTALKRRGYEVVLTREPGGTVIGKKIRALLLHPKYKEMNPRGELMLYEADRSQNFREKILPALAAGKVVISDRSMHSSTVYQGYCRGLKEADIEWLNAFATFERAPDVVLLLDIPVAVSQKRLKVRRRLDRFEQEKTAFHEKVRRGFLKLARKHKKQFCVVDATQTPDEVFAEIEAAVLRRLGAK